MQGPGVPHFQGHLLTTAGSDTAFDVSKLRGHCALATSNPRTGGMEAFQGQLENPALATEHEVLLIFTFLASEQDVGLGHLQCLSFQPARHNRGPQPDPSWHQLSSKARVFRLAG